MEQLANGFTLDIPEGVFPLSTDSIVLADFVRLPKNAKVLDLGSGCGTLGLLLCAQDNLCCVAGVEINNVAHGGAVENIHRNDLERRMESICADLRSVPQIFPVGSFSVCVSNPPYFSGGPVSKTHPVARRDDCCAADELFAAAAWALRYGGDFFLVHRPERLAELCVCGSRTGMELKRLRLVRHKKGGDVTLILLQFRKGGKPGHTWEELCLFDENGEPTDAYRALYHI